MKQKLKRFMASFMAMLTVFTNTFVKWNYGICCKSAGKYGILECVSV